MVATYSDGQRVAVKNYNLPKQKCLIGEVINSDTVLHHTIKIDN